MIRSFRFPACWLGPVLALGLTSTANGADLLTVNDGYVRDNLCVGGSCDASPPFTLGQNGVLLYHSRTRIDFIDTSTSAGSFPYVDWTLQANEIEAAGRNQFMIRDLENGTDPFTISAAAPTGALFVDPAGQIGLGTEMPTGDLHLVDTGEPSIVMERTDFPTYKWGLKANHQAWFVFDETGMTLPFVVDAGAQDYALHVDNTSNVGIGTSTPDAPLELSSTDAFNFFRISATGASVNESVDIVFTNGPLGTGQLRYNIVEGAGPQTPEMTLDADGNMVLTGTLTTAGPTCAGGCDRVFDADYALLSIEDHAAQMYANLHLPAVGPTLPHAPVNVTEKLSRVINELEHAHIYIDQLNLDALRRDAKIQTQQNTISQQQNQISAILERLDTLETQ